MVDAETTVIAAGSSRLLPVDALHRYLHRR
jgi:hypothetical protein